MQTVFSTAYLNSWETYMHREVSRVLRFIIATGLWFGWASYLVSAQSVRFTRDHDPAVEARVDKLVEAMTLDEKIDLLGGENRFRMHPVPRLHIPALQMADGPVGAHIPQPSIAYAGGIGLAASWDEQLAYDIGLQLGRDARSRGASFLLGPGVNIYREPMNGRNFEYFGEDPFLAGRMAVGYIQGVQSQRVSATVKHFLGNNSEYARHTTNAVIDERALREVYMPAFEAAVKQGHVGAIMDAYNLTNGEHMTQNRSLNVDVAKRQWGFSGIIMSDWTSVYSTPAAFNAGLDLEMPFSIYFDRENVKAALASKQISLSALDDKVRRVLRVAASFGWLDQPQLDLAVPRYNLQGKAVSHQAVLEGSVLLKNEGAVLPLSTTEVHRLAVVGPNAALTQTTGGGSGEVVSFAPTSLLAGFATTLAGKTDVLYSRGLYSAVQLASLTNFTTDSKGSTSGVTHETFQSTAPNGQPSGTEISSSMTLNGTAHRDPDEQEIIALDATRTSFGVSASPVSHRFTGYYDVSETAKHLFFVETSHRFRLLVDGKPLLDNSVIQRAILSEARAELTRGRHKVVLEVYGGDRTSELRFPMLVGIVPVSKLVDQNTLKIVANCDAVVLSVGFNSGSESEGGDRSFDLPLGQDDLIEQVAALGKRTVVLIEAGGSVNVAKWRDKVGAIFQAWYPGEDGGTALAELVFGRSNPSGHLPISWELQQEDNPSWKTYYPPNDTHDVAYSEGIYVGYRGYDKLHRKPLYPFGFGLSYTTFEYKNIHVVSEHAGSALVRFTIKNVGSLPGASVAQVYVGEEQPTIDRPEKELKAFQRVLLNPGESREVSLPLSARAFSYYDVKTRDWVVEPGRYSIRVGENSATLPLGSELNILHEIHTPVDQ